MGYLPPPRPGEPDPVPAWYWWAMFAIWGIGLVVIPVAGVIILAAATGIAP